MKSWETRKASGEPVSSLLTELSGYLDLSMTKEAQNMTARILMQPHLSADEFSGAIVAIGMGMNCKKWKLRLESAYDRLSRTHKRRARSAMLVFYCSIGDSKNAERFLSLRSLHSPHELFFAMDVLLELEMLAKAKGLAKKCEKALAAAQTSFDRSLMIEALASYYARIRNWDRAFDLWQVAPRDQPFARRAATGTIPSDPRDQADTYESDNSGSAKESVFLTARPVFPQTTAFMQQAIVKIANRIWKGRFVSNY
jgi:hypothetical protein